MNKPIVLYPLETKKREANGAILLGLKLVEQGYKFFLGPKKELNYQISNLKPNIFIASNAGANAESKTIFSYLKSIGSHIVVIDTEGGVIIEENYKKRHNKDLSKYVDLFFAWGKKGKILIHEGSGVPLDRIKVGGCPWFDFLTDTTAKARRFYNNEISLIEKEYGKDFILYNSRFSWNNTYNKSLAKDINRMSEYDDYRKYSDLLFQEILILLKVLAKHFEDKKIIIRPHPSEGIDLYKKQFAHFPNVFIDNRFNARSWCLLSKATIHNGCTTAIESSMLGIPTISYQPYENPEYDIFLPNLAGIKTATTNEVIRVLESYYNKNERFELADWQLKILNDYIVNFTQNSSEIICNALQDLPANTIRPKIDLKFKLLKIKHYLIKNHLNLIMLFNKDMGKRLQEFREYGNHKFPPMNIEEFKQRLAICKDFLRSNTSIKFSKIEGLESSYSIEKTSEHL